MNDETTCFYCRANLGLQKEAIAKIFSFSSHGNYSMGFSISGFFHPHCLRRWNNLSKEETILIRDKIQEFLMHKLQVRFNDKI